MMGQITFRGDYRKLGNYLSHEGIGKPFLICGNSAEQMNLYKFLAKLGATRFSDFHPNPLYQDAAKATELFRNSDCDCIMGFGGGSAMDVAKCVKLWAAGDAPLVAIPTTAGTGSEATHFAVIYREGEKTSVADERCLPDVVLLDPGTLETLPEYHRKASMLDALCHGIESFWSKKATEESRGFSRQAIQNVLSYLPDYLANTQSGNAGMLEAAHMAGKAINLTQTTAGHAMCYKLTTTYGIAHGHAAALCCAKLWSYMVEKARGTALEHVFIELADIFGCGGSQEAAAKFQRTIAELNLSVPYPMPEDYQILRDSVNAERLANNPIPLDTDEIDMLYHQILGGDKFETT